MHTLSYLPIAAVVAFGLAVTPTAFAQSSAASPGCKKASVAESAVGGRSGKPQPAGSQGGGSRSANSAVTESGKGKAGVSTDIAAVGHPCP
jgi:hypothetical protein